MKIKSAKSILLILFLLVFFVNVSLNYFCLVYLSRVNRTIIKDQTARYVKTIQYETEHSIKKIDIFSRGVCRELSQMSYFENSQTQVLEQKRVLIQKYVDQLNALSDKTIHLFIFNSSDRAFDNYSRILSNRDVERISEYFFSAFKKDSDKENRLGHYVIFKIDSVWYVAHIEPYYQFGYDTPEKTELGQIVSLIAVKEEVLFDELNLPQSMELYIYDTSSADKSLLKTIERQKKKYGYYAEGYTETANEGFRIACVLKDKKDISGFVDSTRIIILQIAVNAALILLALFILSKLIASPLKRMAKRTLSIDYETKKRMPEDIFCYEIQVLSVRLNDLIDKLENRSYELLHAQQRMYELELSDYEREMTALKSQINPHFVCNMLENIRVLSECGRNDDVSLVTVKMARFLRYSLYINGFVTLDDEIESVKNYLDIMKVCYGDGFKTEYCIDDSLKDEAVPKMIIQPLVGNVFKHGINFDHNENIIRIIAEKQGDNIRIVVFDNGCGVEKEELETINRNLKQADRNENRNGFGLYSINRRIKAIYGEEYGVSMQSEKKNFTAVSIVFPGNQKEE